MAKVLYRCVITGEDITVNSTEVSLVNHGGGVTTVEIPCPVCADVHVLSGLESKTVFLLRVHKAKLVSRVPLTDADAKRLSVLLERTPDEAIWAELEKT